MSAENHVAVIGAGFTGLAAAYELERRGIRATVFERADSIGGLAGSFTVGGVPLECFYHHFFTGDAHLIEMIDEVGLTHRIIERPTRTGMYVSDNFFDLSTPLDVLRFKPLSLSNRLRLGLLVLKARRYKTWEALDDLTAEEWIKSLCGDEVFRVAWEPLLTGKFGKYASTISAAWFWGKLTIRGGSRSRTGREKLAYFKGGFSAITDRMAKNLSTVCCNSPVKGIQVENGRIAAVVCKDRTVSCDAVIATPALPIIANVLSQHVDSQFVDRLRRVEYLANICLVLELNRNLSDMYWINVNDPSFPFVGIIEHTNFEPSSSYAGRHVVYLSKYLPAESEMYSFDGETLFAFALPYLKRMFPKLDNSWIEKYHVWRADYAQPVVVKGYRHLIPEVETPVSGFYIATMAQIYPEDRGVNYAIRDGRSVARYVEKSLKSRQ